MDKWGALKEGLDVSISVLGENLSQGEKQLISIARALLKNSQIVLIDEATSNIDEQTEKIINEVLRNSFQNRLVITIAHKIKTVLDHDVIMVLDKGRILEMDSPEKLLAN